ncbi:GNAT family N-acetyltransferase/peptidase C39 family protein [Alteromonadaceae bacterium BrNp21-10]|nr:GNAT family N-acetyltransferase/peptidase C39 family protein [Alteromonadaceae bacterium BrNp21-10]
MPNNMPRLATLNDLPALVELERTCFSVDRLSQRSFRYFLTKSSAEIYVVGKPAIAYGLVLFHKGTSLARIYSLAVHPQQQGKGLARKIVSALESSALEHLALFIRLEVAVDNEPAKALYDRMDYKPIQKLHHYYEDGNDGIRMEKRLQIVKAKPKNLPFYAQTTDFTCGPAALLMAAKHLRPSTPLNQIEELNIWREATTVFMTTGHGGTSPYGLALAAKSRQFDVRLMVSNTNAPFIDSVRNEEKKAVIELIHEDFLQQVKAQKISINPFPKGIEELKQALQQGEQVILLISTYRLNHCKEPHWIWLVHIDENYAYFNDPDGGDEQWKSPMDAIYIPVPLYDFEKMIKYGKKQYKAAILIS